MKYFESEKPLTEFMFIDPKLLYTFASLNQFCHENKIPLRITSMIRTVDSISKSTSHQDSRAMDISTKGWTKKQINDVKRFLKGWDSLHDFGAISKTDKINKLAIFHNAGQGDHLHIQTRK